MELGPGSVVADRYLLDSPIGEGGMGAVFRAHDQTLNRAVAIKLLFVDGARDPKAKVEQFLREARIAASVQHRNVIQTIDFGTIDGAQPYMVMELLSGCSLAEQMEEGPQLPPLQFLHLISLTLRGLSAVHDAGIVHRDLKPANIFLQNDPEGVFPKILDFGISRSLASEERRSAISTREGLIVGTPDYMSPEQARGESDVDRRADIYAMGAMVYEGLAGRLPFLATKVGELIVQIVTKAPTPLAQLCPQLPVALIDVVEQAMNKHAQARFVDARAMRKALNGALEQMRDGTTAGRIGRPVSEAPPATAQALTDQVQPASPGTAPVWGEFEGLGGEPSRPTSDPLATAASAAHGAAPKSSAPTGRSASVPAHEMSLPPPVPAGASRRPIGSPAGAPDSGAPDSGAPGAAKHGVAMAPARGLIDFDGNSDRALEIDYAWGNEYGQGGRPSATKRVRSSRRELPRISTRAAAAKVRSLRVPLLICLLLALWVAGPKMIYSRLAVTLPTQPATSPVPTERPIQPRRRDKPGRHPAAMRDIHFD